jgi:hypothetical protein
VVTSRRHRLPPQRSDLTVSNIHTYYVLAGTAPVLVHNCDLTRITNEQVVGHNRAAMNTHGQHGFSGVYDPVTGDFEARLSGGPNAIVPRTRGHADIDWDVFGQPGNTVGFTVVRNGDTLEVTWRSRSVNGDNFGDPMAPMRYRQPIMDALARATGFRVIG